MIGKPVEAATHMRYALLFAWSKRVADRQVETAVSSAVIGTIDSDLGNRIEYRSRRLQFAVKRLIDVVGSTLLIVLCSPLLVLSAIFVRLSSPGPILFTQARWGLHERHFTCLKFRSMFVKQDHLVDQKCLRELARQGVLLKLESDPRVTRAGALLRRTSLDELPQLFNVLQGEMSLVGPRPLALHMLQPYPELRALRCLMRPGITGLWQVTARSNNDSAMAMKGYDLQYLRDFSLWLDLKILVRTIRAVLSHDGAF